MRINVLFCGRRPQNSTFIRIHTVLKQTMITMWFYWKSGLGYAPGAGIWEIQHR